MKRSIFITLSIAFVATSCTLLTQLAGAPATNTTTGSQQNIENVITTGLFAPMSKSLILTEDPGTGLYGYLNEYGVWAIQPQFRNAYSFNKDLGVAVVQVHNHSWGAINAIGQTVIGYNFTNSSDVFSAINSISKGRYRGIDLWVTEERATGLYGYLDYYGNWYIAPQFANAYSMNDDGLAVVKIESGRWGIIDRSGNFVVQPNFTSSSDAYKALNSLLYR